MAAAHLDGEPTVRAAARDWPARPGSLWARFDAAAAELNRAGGGSDLIAVAKAHELLGDAAGALAAEVAREDRASGLLPRLDTRERRSA